MQKLILREYKQLIQNIIWKEDKTPGGVTMNRTNSNHQNPQFNNKNQHSDKHHSLDLTQNLRKIKDAVLETQHDFSSGMRDIVTESFHNMKNQTSNLQDKVGHFVTSKPAKAMCCTVIAGFIIGRFFS